ncbi:hypothetical protein EHS25_005119 [Saitozyma podzolica]|uniref:ABM domain-containing protein n=1 Tax=Saitozyma podzolica TaxID=1890683 RepID=A0A427Y2I9_9TREE|nr:hypothetical protein EHS25_005119 [Saitozyma podzolica]
MGFVQHVTIRAKPGKASEILKILANIRAEVDQKEPGTKQYHPAQNPEDENDIFIWEEYDSEEALQCESSHPPTTQP